jgi:hypothetical protein
MSASGSGYDDDDDDDDVNLLGDNIDTIKRNTETLIDSSKEVERPPLVEEI